MGHRRIADDARRIGGEARLADALPLGRARVEFVGERVAEEEADGSGAEERRHLGRNLVVEVFEDGGLERGGDLLAAGVQLRTSDPQPGLGGHIPSPESQLEKFTPSLGGSRRAGEVGRGPEVRRESGSAAVLGRREHPRPGRRASVPDRSARRAARDVFAGRLVDLEQPVLRPTSRHIWPLRVSVGWRRWIAGRSVGDRDDGRMHLEAHHRRGAPIGRGRFVGEPVRRSGRSLSAFTSVRKQIEEQAAEGARPGRSSPGRGGRVLPGLADPGDDRRSGASRGPPPRDDRSPPGAPRMSSGAVLRPSFQ